MSPTATVRQGDAMTLTCRVRRSNPLPHTFTWFKDEKALSEERTERYVVQSIQPEDAGDYKCSAINVRGEGTSVPFRVKVQCEFHSSESSTNVVVELKWSEELNIQPPSP